MKLFKTKQTYIEPINDDTKIVSFRNEYSFLSNFYKSTIRYNGKLYKTVEHAYQATKTLDESQQEMIRNAATPAEAKKLGRIVTLRLDWDQIKDTVMQELISLKFDNVLIVDMLLNTGDKTLIEGNNWNDCYWGVCRGVGLNKLGIILMEERTKRRELNGKNYKV